MRYVIFTSSLNEKCFGVVLGEYIESKKMLNVYFDQFWSEDKDIFKRYPPRDTWINSEDSRFTFSNVPPVQFKNKVILDIQSKGLQHYEMSRM